MIRRAARVLAREAHVRACEVGAGQLTTYLLLFALEARP